MPSKVGVKSEKGAIYWGYLKNNCCVAKLQDFSVIVVNQILRKSVELFTYSVLKLTSKSLNKDVRFTTTR